MKSGSGIASAMGQLPANLQHYIGGPGYPGMSKPGMSGPLQQYNTPPEQMMNMQARYQPIRMGMPGQGLLQ